MTNYLHPLQKTLAQIANANNNSSVLTIPQIYQKAQKSVVWIKAYEITGPPGEGSGFIYDYTGYIIANNNVLAAGGPSLGNVNVEITFYDCSVYSAKLLDLIH